MIVCIVCMKDESMKLINSICTGVFSPDEFSEKNPYRS